MKDRTIAVIGLGYVGLPLAVEFGKYRDVIGFDINCKRIEELNDNHDRTGEVDSSGLQSASRLTLTCDQSDLQNVGIYIITVPTPISKSKQPDLGPLKGASRMVGQNLSKGDIIIYESTVYPGCTEDECVPVLEQASGLTFNKDFFCGYSPERINPGDKVNTLRTITKVTSGSTPEIAIQVDELYKEIIDAGTFMASSMKVAEAAKVIENSQRDLNIAFVNELALIFDRIGIDTTEVLKAAGTKWNFLPFQPGLVGGHCIGVDPYYLTFKAESIGYHPQVILSGRRINDSMGQHIASSAVKLMAQNGLPIKNSHMLVMGVTFKENCPDIRNSKVIDIVNELEQYSINVDVFDPWADNEEVKNEFDIDLLDKDSLNLSSYDGIIIAVAHESFKELIERLTPSEGQIIYDVKSVLGKEKSTQRL